MPGWGSLRSPSVPLLGTESSSFSSHFECPCAFWLHNRQRAPRLVTVFSLNKLPLMTHTIRSVLCSWVRVSFPHTAITRKLFDVHVVHRWYRVTSNALACVLEVGPLERVRSLLYSIGPAHCLSLPKHVRHHYMLRRFPSKSERRPHRADAVHISNTTS